MNKLLRSLLLINLTLFLVGCGTNNDNDNVKSKEEDEEVVDTTEVSSEETTEKPSEETPDESEKTTEKPSEETSDESEGTLNEAEKEELFTEFNAASEKIEIYDVDMDLIVELTEGANKIVQRAQLFGTLEESMVNIDMTSVETQGVNKNEMHMYKTGDDVYIQENDADWVKATEESNEYSQSDTSYRNVAKSLDSIHDIVEVSESGNAYEVAYTGDGNVDIFKAFEQPFSLSLTGVDIEETKMDLLFVIDKAEKTMKEINFEITAEKDGTDLLLNVEIEYEDINDTKVKIPEEVIKEAI